MCRPQVRPNPGSRGTWTPVTTASARRPEDRFPDTAAFPSAVCRPPRFHSRPTQAPARRSAHRRRPRYSRARPIRSTGAVQSPRPSSTRPKSAAAALGRQCCPPLQWPSPNLDTLVCRRPAAGGAGATTGQPARSEVRPTGRARRGGARGHAARGAGWGDPGGSASSATCRCPTVVGRPLPAKPILAAKGISLTPGISRSMRMRPRVPSSPPTRDRR